MPNQNTITPNTKTSVSLSGNLSIQVDSNDLPLYDFETLDLILMPPPKLSEVELLEDANYKNQVYGIEGELLANVEGDILLFVDVDGNLSISEEFSSNYEIDQDGNLVYNYFQ